MKIIKEEAGSLYRIRKNAYSLGEKVSIFYKPFLAKSFLFSLRNRIKETRSTYKKLTKQVGLYKHLTHEVENLFDNYYIVDSAIVDILNSDVEKDFKRLVQIEKKPGVFIPRIYFILSELLKISSDKIDRETLYCFLQAYQTKAHLSIRELSFVPYFLKVILVENIRNVMHNSVVSLNEFKEAEYWFEQIVKGGEGVHDYSKLTSSLTVKYGVIPVNVGFYLLQRLSQYGPDTRPVVKWLKLNLLKQGINISDLAEIENKRQDGISIQIGNIINGLRWVNQARWDDFVVDLNVVDSFLAKDPVGIYTKLDQTSQMVYRNEVVKIGDRSGVYESEVAKLALRLCQSENHIGHYLVGPGREELERKIGYQRTLLENIQSFVLKYSTPIYLSLIFFLNAFFTFIFYLFFSAVLNWHSPSLALLLVVFALNSDITINLINILVSHFIPVRALFRLDLSSGPSVEQSTFVIVPSMFRDSKSAEELIRRLEINYLGNSAKNIFYALLMDFKDARTETTPEDQFLVDEISQKIEALNKKYPTAIKTFYLFHRRRLWNPQEGVFMGWERKRGKLREFNLLLRNNQKTSYFEALPTDLPKIKYILTIDEDTRLPKDSAGKLIGCIDHPLNRPIVDPVSGRVVSGYGIIQPRMTAKFSQAGATVFSRLFSSAMGIDSYSGPVADVYQDLFNNSIFYGKGIYDIDTMEKTIGDKIPANQVLSHDLLEGLYTRVGFATDIFLFEGFPGSYKEYVLRMQRWIRGDWQIIRWLRNSLAKGNHFTLSDKWKIFDNLRRSTMPVFSVIFLLLAQLYFLEIYPYFLLYTLFIVGSPFIISYLMRVFEWPKEMTIFSKINSLIDNLDDVLLQIVYRFIFLLDQSLVSLSAIVISLYRQLVSRERLLRWQNSHEVSKSLSGTLREFLYTMSPTLIVSFVGLFLLLKTHDGFYSYLTLLFWIISPLIAYQISRPEKPFHYRIQDRALLRKIACRSARFFLELSERGGNFLIPDHYQEEPVTNSPAATSPTNIGMHLLSNFSAYDFGYLSFSELLTRTKNLCVNLDSLERYRGHFYNWYDIRTLQSLSPKYVSSVDSANLLVSLITLKQGILDIIKKPVISQNSLSGLADVLAVLTEDIDFIIKDKSISKVERKLVRRIYGEIEQANRKYLFALGGLSVEELTKIFNSLSDVNDRIKKIISNLNLGQNRGILSSIYSSTDHFNVLLKQQVDELNTFAPFYQICRSRPVIRNEKKNQRLADTLSKLLSKLNTIQSLDSLAGNFKDEIAGLDFISVIHKASLDNAEKENIENWYEHLIQVLASVEERALKAKGEYMDIISLLDKFYSEADFSFLYNKERGLFHIGYNVTFDKIDNSYYDFLASEANAISFIAILKGEVPVKHWFYLGRKLVRLDTKNVLLSSWGGSLFEYLTSLIFFKTHPKSLLGHTARLAIKSHMKYGAEHLIPWGMGESAYSTLDLNNNYQYQIFGHPALGFKRDLKDYLVIAPYTTILSLSFEPHEAISNLKKMIKLGFLGRYGFYDAIDYTPKSGSEFDPRAGNPAKIYYAHHQGFSLQALNNQINQDRMRALFSADPRVESLDTLFEEKIPSSIPARPIKTLERPKTEYSATGNHDAEVKQFIPLHTSYPRRAFISNGTYSVNISNTGTGESRVGDLGLTRFRKDTVAESWGQFIYIQDLTKNNFWSPTTEPAGENLGRNKIEYFENKAKFNKIFNNIESSLVVAVAPDSDVEFRTLTLTNHGKEKRNLTITSYGEVSLAKNSDDLHHPAFEKLFVKAEYWQKYHSLVYTRPNKVERGTTLFLAHRAVTNQPEKISFTHLADRGQFISRGGSSKEPAIFSPTYERIKPNLGYTFDPIFCLKGAISLEPNETITVTYQNVFGTSAEEIIKNFKKYPDQKRIDQAIKKSDVHGHDIISNLGISQDQALNFQTLASRLLSPQYSVEKKPLLTGTEAGVQALWRHGISGDHPILLVRFYDLNDLALIKNILLCHKYLKYKGISHDLVLLNEYPASYLKSFEDEVDFLIRYNQSPQSKVIPGNVFHLRTSHLRDEDQKNILALASVTIDGKLGTLEQQIVSISQSAFKNSLPLLLPVKKATAPGKDIYPDLSDLSFFNGYGGFDQKKDEYVLGVNYAKTAGTRAPWVNVIANNNIGTVITESGSAYTWLYDSYDNRLTKRIDDPLTDQSGEVFYLRDEETGEFWNPTPLPIKNAHTYTVRHGLGYTKIESRSHGLDQEMLTFVPVSDAVKIIKFKITNRSRIVKKMSLSAYFEISVGGANREDTKDHLQVYLDAETGAVLAKNNFCESFKNTIAFVDFDRGQALITNDREEFLGRNGDLARPLALRREKLSNMIYDQVDPCIAGQTFFEIAPGEQVEIVTLFGGGNDLETIQKTIRKYRSIAHCETALGENKEKWDKILNQVKIQTPDESLNILFNSRLLYQLMSSRLLARTGYYQPSGAYGFRDQLQDSMALVWARPDLTKEIILKASRHQFFEGDGQNWWHEHNNFGVRNVFSDHQLWLPYVVAYYLEVTGDQGILTEEEAYLKAPLLDFINNPTWAGVPEITSEKYDIYDHCLRAIEKTFVFGRNGLPLIGRGDWNDGLNNVGPKGQGESVWLGWFLCAVIKKFIPYIQARGDHERIKRYELTLQNLESALEKNAWDGRWYKRAFFDSGVPLGSSRNREFKIDSISQSWSVLSGSARPERSRQAMNSAAKHLFQDDLFLLISPAIKNTEVDLGYIRDYPPGVRENASQYNHAALWSAQAFAVLGDAVSMMKIINSINPIKRTADRDKASLYQVEPYVVASDIYAKPASAGRGGWTWYTGSAGVMYRTILESLLGLRVRGNKMEINPCIPKDWNKFSLTYTYKSATYNIQVLNSLNVINKKIRVDGDLLSANIINLMDDGRTHEIEVKI